MQKTKCKNCLKSNMFLHSTGYYRCRDCAKTYLKKWRHRKGISKKYHEFQGKAGTRTPAESKSFYWFGSRDAVQKVLERDNYQCRSCRLTNEEHQEKWGVRLSIDHIDGNGRNVPRESRNNNISNLQALCLSCHGKKDGKRRRKKL